MRNKAKLRQEVLGVSIEYDYTDNERQKEIQIQIEEKVDRWKIKGKSIKKEYMKLCIDGIWLTWDEEVGEIVQAKERKRKFSRIKALKMN